ncbi:squalene synthase HpnC [Alcaligenaceae bacterium A4P071]|nr:squalene synthase HpnC [Alcaligenaceae bacterium B3P038]MDQ2187325.1 squalene synthase HpnC [Alcaligenaceae bacterium A4P071]
MAVNHYENFPVASVLLPRRLRRAVGDIYRFARTADDIADEGDDAPAIRRAGLARYRIALHAIAADPRDPQGFDAEVAPIFKPLAATISRHQLPITPFFHLLEAFEQDIDTHRYATAQAVDDYCTRSANPVGRLMLHLHEAATPENLTQADAICTGLQWTNFLQDVQIDLRKDRVYLPQEDLARFGVTEAAMRARTLSPEWTALMAFEVERTRALLHFGAPLARRLPGRVGFELRLVVQGGLRILERIAANRYDVFMNRPQLEARDWSVMVWRALVKYDA